MTQWHAADDNSIYSREWLTLAARYLMRPGVIDAHNGPDGAAGREVVADMTRVDGDDTVSVLEQCHVWVCTGRRPETHRVVRYIQTNGRCLCNHAPTVLHIQHWTLIKRNWNSSVFVGRRRRLRLQSGRRETRERGGQERRRGTREERKEKLRNSCGGNLGAAANFRSPPSPRQPKICVSMPSSRPTGILLCHFWNSKMSQFLHAGVWFSPFAISVKKLHLAYTPKCTVKILYVSLCMWQKMH